MKITRHNQDALVLAGRRQDLETGQEGLWLVWLVGVVLIGGGAVLTYVLTERWSELPEGGLWAPTVLGVGVALFGAGLLGLGTMLLFRRERLVLDRGLRQGRYAIWSPKTGWSDRQQFSFDQATRIVMEEIAEVVSEHSLPGAYRKWQVRLELQWRKPLELARTGKRRRAEQVAVAVAEALGIQWTERQQEES